MKSLADTGLPVLSAELIDRLAAEQPPPKIAVSDLADERSRLEHARQLGRRELIEMLVTLKNKTRKEHPDGRRQLHGSSSTANDGP